jgi:hypothetical protein
VRHSDVLMWSDVWSVKCCTRCFCISLPMGITGTIFTSSSLHTFLISNAGCIYDVKFATGTCLNCVKTGVSLELRPCNIYFPIKFIENENIVW